MTEISLTRRYKLRHILTAVASELAKDNKYKDLAAILYSVAAKLDGKPS